eukprot:5746734-Pyramimonas_sp.AAC.1
MPPRRSHLPRRRGELAGATRWGMPARSHPRAKTASNSPPSVGHYHLGGPVRPRPPAQKGCQNRFCSVVRKETTLLKGRAMIDCVKDG